MSFKLKDFSPELQARMTGAAGPAARVPGPPAHVPGRMNKTEQAYARRLDLLKAGGEVRCWRFEGLKLRLADPGGAGRGVWLTVDFVVEHADGRVTLDEVKGPYVREDALVKFRWAAQSWPTWHFRMWQKRGDKWDLLRESEPARAKAGKERGA